jgi:hypothetical protein
MASDPSRRLQAWTRLVLGPRLPAPSEAHPLIRCRHCDAPYVVPSDVEQRGEDRWWMALRCGACGAYRELVATSEEADAYGSELDAGLRLIAAELARLERERMDEEARILAIALDRDLIDAADFAPRDKRSRGG